MCRALRKQFLDTRRPRGQGWVRRRAHHPKSLKGSTVKSMRALRAPSLEFIRAGKLRALAVTTATRSPALPDVPSVAETVPGYEATAWAGMGAPKGTPPEIIERLNGQINAGLASPIA